MIDDRWLQERTAYWQEVLRLQDWRIAPRFVDAHELLDASGNTDDVSAVHSNARVSWDMPSRHARVKVCKPEQIPPIVDVVPLVDPLSDDPEVLLVHELLHISLADLEWATGEAKDDKLEEIALERHVINLSKALVILDRRCGGGKDTPGLTSSEAWACGPHG